VFVLFIIFGVMLIITILSVVRYEKMKFMSKKLLLENCKKEYRYNVLEWINNWMFDDKCL
jgi:hypothetical protein